MVLVGKRDDIVEIGCTAHTPLARLSIVRHRAGSRDTATPAYLARSVETSLNPSSYWTSTMVPRQPEEVSVYRLQPRLKLKCGLDIEIRTRAGGPIVASVCFPGEDDVGASGATLQKVISARAGEVRSCNGC